MTAAEKLIKTAKQLMALQSEFARDVAAVENDHTIPTSAAHMIIAESINLASGFYDTLREGNKKYLEEMVDHNQAVHQTLYIAGVEIPGRTYTPKPVTGFEVLNKEDPTVWAMVLEAASKTNPEVIQKRLTDSKVTREFLEACGGLVAEKPTGAITWSITKTK